MKTRIALLALLVVLVTYVFGPRPNSPNYTLELPSVPHGPLAVENFIGEREKRPDIKENNQARFIWANDSSKEKTNYVLLYLHGFSASRVEGEPTYIDFANRYGMNAFAPRLATQGLDTIDEMIDYRPERLWESAKEALAVAEELGNKIIIMSTSTGGTLAIKLAATYPDKIYGLINLSPNIRPKDPRAWLLNMPWGLQISRFVFDGKKRVLEPKDTIYHKYWYQSYRLESVVFLQELVESTMNEKTFDEVNCPVLNLYYYKNEEEQDDVVSTERIKWMHDALATEESKKQLIAIPNAGTHVIGCSIYSHAIIEVESAAFNFAEEVLQLKPITLAP